MPPTSTKAKDIRAQGVASVTQDMSSARLKILGDLMENRKRAEQHEQEFLRTIHSENAAFSRIVSLFEESIEEVKENTSHCSAELQSATESYRKNLGDTRVEIERRLDCELLSLKQSVDKLESGSTSGVAALTEQVDSIQNKLTALTSSIECRSKEDQMKIDELKKTCEALSTTLSSQVTDSANLQCEFIHQLLSTFRESLDTELASMKVQYDASIDRIRTDLNERLTASETSLKQLIESRIGGLEEQLMNALREQKEAVTLGIAEAVQEASNGIKSDIRTEIKTSSEHLRNRLSSVEERISSLPETSFVNQAIEKAMAVNRVNDDEMNANEERVRSLEQQLKALRSEMQTSLSSHKSIMTAIASSGFRYEWNISNAIARFTSLGLLGGNGGKFVSSETFNIGPYKNLSLRFFPISTVNGDSPTVWLIARPLNPDAILPVFVDIGIGTSKRGPLKRKQVQELFGHWVWEASFPSDVITAEMREDDLFICAEISMRQWMDLDRLAQNVAPVVNEESETPESPSAMSNYTFVPVAEKSIIMPQTNPFENQGSVTPRRSSWAQFGSPPPDENETINTTRLASNPFK
jgi:hypothetical protein